MLVPRYIRPVVDATLGYQVHRSDRHFSSRKVTVIPFVRFCAELHMP